MRELRAIHIVSTTYGTWLPGDPRKPGHWSPMMDVYGRIKARGGRLNEPDLTTFHAAQAFLKEPPLVLSEVQRGAVVESFRKTILNVGDDGTPTPGKPGAICRVMALAVEPTHFHLLVGPLGEPLPQFVGRLKGRASSAVLQSSTVVRSRSWTTGYWKVFLFDDIGVADVQRYIEDHNLARGEAANPYPWVQPFP